MNYYDAKTAKQIYDSMRGKRDAFLRRARRASALTIPSLVPPDGHTAVRDFADPEQSLGARGLNHLSSKLLLTLLPPSAQMFRLVPDSVARELLAGEDPDSIELRADVDRVFAGMEQEVQAEVEHQGLRVSGAEILKHLVCAGNVCMFLPDEGGLEFYPLSMYVCKRDPRGNVLCFVLREELSPHALPDDVRELALQTQEQYGAGAALDTETVEVFTKVVLRDGKYYVHQEINGTLVPGSEGEYLKDETPFHVLRWTKVAGEDYGRGLIEEYFGDLSAIERLSRATVDGALAMARLVGLVSPNGTTDPHDMNEAENGDWVYGDADDISFAQVQKFHDFQVVMQEKSVIAQRLEDAFLLNRSATRQAERVTMGEISFVAQDLEAALGGVYSILAQEFQLPLIKRLLSRLQSEGRLPKFEGKLKDHIHPTIVTGVDALGRFQELERVRSVFRVMQGVIGPDQVAAVTNLGPLVDFLFANAGVRIEGLIKSEEQIAQEQQQAQMMQAAQSLVQQGTAPVINNAAAQGDQQ